MWNQTKSHQNRIMEKWTGGSPIFPLLSQSPRYDSDGKFLDSLPDLLEARWKHACTTLEFPNGTEVLKKILFFPLCCFEKQILLVAGGIDQNDKYLSSVELLLPNQQWTKGGDLPRH